MSDQIPDSATRRTFHWSVVDEFLTNGGKVGGPCAEHDSLLLTTRGSSPVRRM